MPDFSGISLYAALCALVMLLRAILSMLDPHGNEAGQFWLWEQAEILDSQGRQIEARLLEIGFLTRFIGLALWLKIIKLWLKIVDRRGYLFEAALGAYAGSAASLGIMFAFVGVETCFKKPFNDFILTFGPPGSIPNSILNALIFILLIVVPGVVAVRQVSRKPYRCKLAKCSLHHEVLARMSGDERFACGLYGYGLTCCIVWILNAFDTRVHFLPFFTIPVGIASVALILIGAYLEDRVDAKVPASSD